GSEVAGRAGAGAPPGSRYARALLGDRSPRAGSRHHFCSRGSPVRHRFNFWMSPLEHKSFLWLDDQYRGLLTPAGRVLLWGAVAAAVLLLGGLVLPLIDAFAFCVAALVVAVLAGVFFRPRLRMTRAMPPPVSAGDELTYRVLVRN